MTEFEARPPRIYFYCSDEPGNLQEDIIAIAEGLSELGIPYYANCDYWLRSTTPGDYLFRRDPDVSHRDCDVVVVSYTWPLWVRMGDFAVRTKPLPDGLFERGRGWATVFMDNFDGYRTISWEPEYRQFDLILRSKFNDRAYHPDNMRPWAYGLTERVRNATADGLPFAKRTRKILSNFGASHPFPYGARELARRRFEPRIANVLPVDKSRDDLSIQPRRAIDRLMWHQTGRRFSVDYYKRLKSSQALACFCGDIIPPAPHHPEQLLVGGNRARLRRFAWETLGLVDPRSPRAVGADSFRFWEALAAGCAAINLDLAHYGVRLPVMPRNGKHYLGVDLDRVDDFTAMLIEQPKVLEHVAESGRTWAETYYSPVAVAKRFLSMLAAEPRREDGVPS